MAVLILSLQRVPRPGPIMFVGLQLQQHVAGFFMLGLQGKGFFGQLQRRLRIPLSQLLLHDAAHADKAGFLILDQLAICPFGLAVVSGKFGGLCGQKVGQRGALEVAVRLGSFGHRQLPLAAGQSHQPVRQRLIAFTLTVAVKVARQRGFISVKEMPSGRKQRHDLEQQPDCQHQQQHGNYRLQRPKSKFCTRDGQLNAAFAFQQEASAPRKGGNQHDEQNDFN